MLTIALRFIDWFIPERAKRTRSDLGRARTFVFTHLVGPVTGQSIAAFLFLADPSPDSHIVVIAAGYRPLCGAAVSSEDDRQSPARSRSLPSKRSSRR